MSWTRNEWAETIGIVGIASLIGGYFRYSYEGQLRLVSEILLIGGGVLVLGAMVLGFRGILKFFSRRSSQLGTNTSILTLAVIAILAVLNYLGFEHHKRFDLTTEKLFTLSDQTRNIVGGLKADVHVVRFAKTPDEQLNDLMAEYKNLNPHLKFENVDPDEKPDVAKEYGAPHSREAVVVVASGDRKETVEGGPEGGPSESDITSAILKVTRNQVKTVCFVTGHDEKSLADNGADGYAAVAEGIKKETFNTKSVNLVTEDAVPSDCDVVVIAGPTTGYFSGEVGKITKYLDGGGKALIEIDPDTDPKLDAIFQSWNISVGKNYVVDASGVGRLFGTGPAVPLVVDYGTSPITKNLQGGMTFFDLARTVSIANKSKSDPESVELLKTSPRSFTIPKLQHEVSFDAKTDTRGPLSLAVAATKKSGDKTSRLVVIGDSDFATNQWIGLQHNGDLMFNIIDWLAQDENLISIRPKSVTNRNVTLTEGQWTALWWLDLFVLPGLVIFTGITIWWRRR